MGEEDEVRGRQWRHLVHFHNA